MSQNLFTLYKPFSFYHHFNLPDKKLNNIEFSKIRTYIQQSFIHSAKYLKNVQKNLKKEKTVSIEVFFMKF